MRQYFTLLSVIIPFCLLQAQSVITDSIVTEKPMHIEKRKGFISKIGHLLNDLDTVYVSPAKYNLAFMLENSYWYESYHLRSRGDRPQKLSISPDVNPKLGAYIGWQWIFIGYSIDLKNLSKRSKEQRTEFALSLYSSFVGCDLYYRKNESSFKLRNMHDFLPENHTGKVDKNINGFSVDIVGLDAFWVVNRKRFSYPAIYSQTTNQRRNAGSVIVGLSFSKHNVNFDYEKIPSFVQDQLSDDLRFKKLIYTDYSLSVGYAYNWVFARNCLANISLTPAIAYKHSKISSENKQRSTLDNLNLDLITRAGITYNNAKYFVGISLVMHSYNYHSSKFFFNQNLGTIRLYAGFNFFKKKQYRNKQKK